ncbi:peptide ABC transporter [Rhodococcus ruber Chol-4]|uniref:Putative peptide transport system permease protein BruAb2_1031 n=1 Tax=Rhodococcus ruber TaxID=1830 RepID=A0A098BHY0_9NOCA|nr:MULTISPECIES: ABC transporter permease [Rhodococcus]MDO2379026.1 ABC transporter permease [Rhodococcus ruber]RIJ99671.1 MAG: ABC transporter permease [Acidobacteriota bacterium]AUM18197.1 ABC transporter permease [Rhodococcus ruber]AWH00653.1 ABC transporter permease [Rhodococcus ruber]KXF85793.1 peptide ABC transporter [Rhodococcus ruber Chol-4]
MLRLIGQRLLAVLPLLLIATAITFGLIFLIPGDPAHRIAGETATPEQIELVRTELGLDQPVVVQYADFLGGLVRGDLGTSFTYKAPVLEMIVDRLPVTVSLTLVAVLVALAVGIPAGIVGGSRPGSWQDRATSVGSTLGVATPNFVLGLILVLVFALQLRVLPATGYTPLAKGVWPWLSHLLLPAIALGLAAAAEIARQLRSSMIEVMQQDFVRTATAKGLGRRSVLWKHALKNAFIPTATVLGMQIAFLLGGTAVIESVFGLKGLGDFAVQAVLSGDLPAIQGVVIFGVFATVVMSLLVDISYGYLNPRTRSAA